MDSAQTTAAAVLRQLMERAAGERVRAVEQSGCTDRSDVLEGLALAGFIELDARRSRWRLVEQFREPRALPVLELLCRLLDGEALPASPPDGSSYSTELSTPAEPVAVLEGPVPTSGVVSLDIAARAVGVNRWTLNDWARQGRVPTYRTPRGHRRFDIDELRAWLSER